MNKVWFITGASKGFGRELVNQLLAKGKMVAASSRNVSAFDDIKDENFLAVEIKNLSDAKEVKTAVDKIVNKFGQLDVLINNAGYGQTGPFEMVSDKKIREQFEVNVFGLMNVTRQVLPVMREQKSGWVINISSIAGFTGNEAFSTYNASKFAVDGWTEAMALGMKSFGIKFMSVMPSGFATDFLDPSSMRDIDIEIEDYKTWWDEMSKQWSSYNHKQEGNVELGMKAIIDAIEADSDTTHLFLGKAAYQMADARMQKWEKEIDDNRDTLAGNC